MCLHWCIYVGNGNYQTNMDIARQLHMIMCERCETWNDAEHTVFNKETEEALCQSCANELEARAELQESELPY